MKKITKYIRIFFCIFTLEILSGCTPEQPLISIYNVGNSIDVPQFVCCNSEHYYYYAEGSIYADDGRKICNMGKTFSNDISACIAVDDFYFYYYDTEHDMLVRIDLETGEEIVLERGVSVAELYSFKDGVFVSYLKGNRYFKYYSHDTVLSLYDNINENPASLESIGNLINDEYPVYIYKFDQYKLTVAKEDETPEILYISDGLGTEYSVFGQTSTYVVHNGIYELIDSTNYNYNGERCNYNFEAPYLENEEVIKPKMVSVMNDNIYTLYVSTLAPASGSIDQEILTEFNTETMDDEIIYQTEDNENIVNYSVEDNRLYILKNGKIYRKALDAPDEDGVEVCDIPKEYFDLGFEYIKGNLFIYDDAQKELIGIYK